MKHFDKFSSKEGLKQSILKPVIIFRARGYNQEEIAGEVGVSRNTVRRYEKKLKKLERIDMVKIMSEIAHSELDSSLAEYE